MEPAKTILSHVMTANGELQLQHSVAPDGQNQPVYEIIFNGVFLMASYNELSERRLADLAIEPLISERRGLHVLVGGLGVGYTLQAVLAWEGIQAVDVVEIEEHIIGWAKTYFSGLNGHACCDQRVSLINMDLWDYILTTKRSYDAILLDVDNGPTWLVLGNNKRLYEKPGLVKIKALLRSGGAFVVWAAQRCMAFQTRVEEVFGRAELITVRDRDRRARSTDYFISRARSFEGPSNDHSKPLVQ
jgi:spermidine synthase